MDDLGQDAAAVAAVRAGDAERYRELVERHERQVYAVAWSRLGDAELAEEAAQEAFIKGYRRLWLLGDGAKFAGWIAAIARNAAINLGMRHRRELQKRQRWALEQPSVATGSAEEAENSPSPEVLRASLMELPAAHRECLVVFYLEGKSGEEAALALGISESAFRVRLHRAKAALRERLEDKLADSLASLRPKKSLVPAVMLSVLATSSASAATVGAGIGTKVLTSLGKSTLFGWLMPLIGLVGILPSMVFMWWWGRLERQNFRQQDGFRTRLHEQAMRSFFWGFPLVLVVVLLFNSAGFATWGVSPTLLLFSCLMSIPLYRGIRSLIINQSHFNVGMLGYSLVMTAGIIVKALNWLPQTLGILPMLAGSVLFLMFIKDRPRRMDYNLFLRASQGMMPPLTDGTKASPGAALSREALLSFARFLGERWLAVDFRWRPDGLLLFLPPVGLSFVSNMVRVFLPMPGLSSTLLLKWEGIALAGLSGADADKLVETNESAAPVTLSREQQVSQAVTHAWQAFRGANVTLAERSLGELTEEEVFMVTPAKAKSTRWMQIYMGATIALMVMLLLVMILRPQWFSNLKPVALSETQVRTALVRFVEKGGKTPVGDGVTYSLMNCFVFPNQELFDEKTVSTLKSQLKKSADFEPDGPADEKVSRLEHGWLLGRGVAAGWLSLEELKVTSTQMRSYLGAHKLPHQKCIFSQRSVPTDAGDHTVSQLDSRQLAQLRVWQRLDCLDLVDREKLIHQLASWQVSHREAYADRPPMPDWRQARGLFATAGWPAIQDTYFVVAGLEILGGLDKIDREACILGILRLHQGRGFFAAKRTQERGNIQVRGDAKDTFCAFETLRILGALDRIDDLEEWQFRVRSNRKTEEVTWDEIEAWVCQQRFERMLRERKANPQSPVRSLLEP